MKKKGFNFIIIVLFCTTNILLGQTYYRMNAANNGTTVNFSCPITNTRFADEGADATHYTNATADYSITFCAPAGKLLKFDFGCGSNLTTERIHNSDTLFIYNGSSTSSPLLYKVTGNSANTFRLTYFKETSTAVLLSPSSCITFRFKTNAANNDDGWDACISCVDEINCGTGNLPASDLFLGAPTICNFTNYCGTTSGDFGADMPVNLNSAGGSCPSGLNFLGTVENNSWLKFQATSTTASFDFNVALGGSCLNGIQTAIFSYNGTSLTRVSNCALSDGSHSGNFTLASTSSLTVGETYYLMIDGNAGDICDYTINATAGVVVADAGADQSICTSSTTLNAGTIVGTGTWTVVSGSGTFADPNSNSTAVTGLTGGINEFQWTVSNSLCGTISDNILVDAGCLLPIELQNFKGTCQKNKNLITWQTISERNNMRFEIERSINGIDFYNIGNVNASNNTNEIIEYSFNDIKENNHLNYFYRLKQIDFNGHFSYSNIIYVESICELSPEITIYPNPSSGIFSLELLLPPQSQLQIIIYNELGQEIKHTETINTEESKTFKTDLNISEFPDGVYHIKTIINSKTINSRIIKL